MVCIASKAKSSSQAMEAANERKQRAEVLANCMFELNILNFSMRASHGGKGGKGYSSCTTSQTTYGDPNAPTTAGSSARDIKGGGVVRIEASGTLTMGANSRISSNSSL